LELGFDRVATGPVTPPIHGAAFERWLDAGYAGEMSYLERTRGERLDPARLLPGARSLVAVALVYANDTSDLPRGRPAVSGDPPALDDRPTSRAARSARGRDYHDVMRPRLETLARFIEAAAGPGIRSRAAVDTSAVLERDLAAAIGLGWIGKNTNLIRPDV